MSEEKKLCSKCGATLAEDALFCSNCGTPAASTAGRPPSTPRRREYREEKDEKYEKREKYEKGEKYEQREKSGDRTGAVIGGLVLIWLGLSFYLAQTTMIPWANWWAYFLSGLGVIIILNGLIRYSESGYRYSLTGSLIGGAVILVIGLTFLVGVRDFWPIILIVIGVAIIISSLTARGRAPRP